MNKCTVKFRFSGEEEGGRNCSTNQNYVSTTEIKSQIWVEEVSVGQQSADSKGGGLLHEEGVVTTVEQETGVEGV